MGDRYWSGWGGPQSPLLHGVQIDHPKAVERSEIDLVERVVAFVDVLGFRRLVENTSDEASVSAIFALENALYHVGNHPHLTFEISKLFSDTMYFSAPVHWAGINWTIGKSIVAQGLFIAQGLLLRGGLSTGRHYESAKVLFSDALVRSYDLERLEARYPRILVHNDLWQLAHSYRRGDPYEPTNPSDPDFVAPRPNEMMLEDSDGRHFLDYFRFLDFEPEFGAIHEQAIRSGAEAYRDNPKVLSMYRWMANYHNRSDRYGWSDSSRIEVDDLFLNDH